MNIYKPLGLIAIFFIAGCDDQQTSLNLSQDEQAILREGCELIKSVPRQSKCFASLNKLSSDVVAPPRRQA